MACRQLIQFPAIYRDGELLKCVNSIGVDCGEVRILGEKTEKAWDAANFNFKQVTGFFIAWHGIEYGSVSMTQSDFLLLCENACQPAEPFQIFDFEFEDIFE